MAVVKLQELSISFAQDIPSFQQCWGCMVDFSLFLLADPFDHRVSRTRAPGLHTGTVGTPSDNECHLHNNGIVGAPTILYSGIGT